MAHTGFSVFFLLSLLTAAVALGRAAWHNFERIRTALACAPASEESKPEFRLKVCPTSEVPRIASRLRVTFPEGLAPVFRVPRAWPFEREASLIRQVAAMDGTLKMAHRGGEAGNAAA